MEQLQLTEEQKEAFKKAIEAFENVWESIKKVVSKLIDFIKSLYKNPLYRSLYKADRIKYYESISEGKSNNWRKAHGLSLIRKRQLCKVFRI